MYENGLQRESTCHAAAIAAVLVHSAVKTLVSCHSSLLLVLMFGLSATLVAMSEVDLKRR